MFSGFLCVFSVEVTRLLSKNQSIANKVCAEKKFRGFSEKCRGLPLHDSLSYSAVLDWCFPFVNRVFLKTWIIFWNTAFPSSFPPATDCDLFLKVWFLCCLQRIGPYATVTVLLQFLSCFLCCWQNASVGNRWTELGKLYPGNLCGVFPDNIKFFLSSGFVVYPSKRVMSCLLLLRALYLDKLRAVLIIICQMYAQFSVFDRNYLKQLKLFLHLFFPSAHNSPSGPVLSKIHKERIFSVLQTKFCFSWEGCIGCNLLLYYSVR